MSKRLWIQLYNSREGSSITLPVNPESIDIGNEKDVQTHNILGYGEVAIRGLKKLLKITLTAFLPEKDTYLALLASFINKTEYKPYTTVGIAKMIDEWIEKNDIIRVIITDGANEDVNKEFMIEKFTKTIRENTESLNYVLELVEYDIPDTTKTTNKTTRIDNDKKIVNLIKRSINRHIPNELVVKSGQTIYKIAKLYYGGKSKELAKLNKIYNQNKDLGGQIIEMLPID